MYDIDFSSLFWFGLAAGILICGALWGVYELLDWLLFPHIQISWT